MTPSQAEAEPKRDPRALNAYRHGLTGQVHIGTPAEQEAYGNHCKVIHDSLAPVGGIEIELAQDIADDRWRLKLGKAIERTIFADGIFTADQSEDQHPEAFEAFAMAATWMKDSKNVALLGLYVNRIDHAVERKLKLLEHIQTARKAALQKLAEEANLLVEFAESRRESYDIEREFPPQFDFSNKEVAQLATHLRRLASAQVFHKSRLAFQKKAA